MTLWHLARMRCSYMCRWYLGRVHFEGHRKANLLTRRRLLKHGLQVTIHLFDFIVFIVYNIMTPSNYILFDFIVFNVYNIMTPSNYILFDFIVFIVYNIMTPSNYILFDFIVFIVYNIMTPSNYILFDFIVFIVYNIMTPSNYILFDFIVFIVYNIIQNTTTTRCKSVAWHTWRCSYRNAFSMNISRFC